MCPDDALLLHLGHESIQLCEGMQKIIHTVFKCEIQTWILAVAVTELVAIYLRRVREETPGIFTLAYLHQDS